MTEPSNVGAPAATVVLLRDGPDGMETLLLVRNQAADFAGGAAVFPGGRVEESDWLGVDPGDELEAARRAAARETIEEAGLVVDPLAFVTLSHWQPPSTAPKRFLTWFFVAAATPEAVVAVDGAEIVEHVWTTPAAAMAAKTAGRLGLLPPTWVTLEWLSRQPSVDEALAAAAARLPPRYQSTIVPLDGGMLLLYEGDAALSSDPPDPSAPGPRHRLVATGDDWRWEDTVS
ncbi:MAG TPA: NUDIX domain-containing protein [Acidimicrobiales bacterium]